MRVVIVARQLGHSVNAAAHEAQATRWSHGPKRTVLGARRGGRDFTLREASNYALTLIKLGRYAEARAFTRNRMPVASRVLGDNNDITLKMRRYYAMALYRDAGASLNDLREAVTTLEDTTRITRRVFGGAHPSTVDHEQSLRNARAALRARKTPPTTRDS